MALTEVGDEALGSVLRRNGRPIRVVEADSEPADS